MTSSRHLGHTFCPPLVHPTKIPDMGTIKVFLQYKKVKQYEHTDTIRFLCKELYFVLYQSSMKLEKWTRKRF